MKQFWWQFVLFCKTAVLSHFKIGGFVSFSKSAVFSHFRNRRFCLIFGIGGFVSFSESAILTHLRSALLSCPRPEYIKSPQCDVQSYSSFVFSGDVIPGTISLEVLFRYYPAPSIIRLSNEIARYNWKTRFICAWANCSETFCSQLKCRIRGKLIPWSKK